MPTISNSHIPSGPQNWKMTMDVALDSVLRFFPVNNKISSIEAETPQYFVLPANKTN